MLAASRDSAIRSFMSAPHRRASRRSSSDKGDSTLPRGNTFVFLILLSLSLSLFFPFFLVLLSRSLLSREQEYGWFELVDAHRRKQAADRKRALPSNRVTRSKGWGCSFGHLSAVKRLGVRVKSTKRPRLFFERAAGKN